MFENQRRGALDYIHPGMPQAFPSGRGTALWLVGRGMMIPDEAVRDGIIYISIVCWRT